MCAALLGPFRPSVKPARSLSPERLKSFRFRLTSLRTIMGGDVHGWRIELEALLDRVGFTSGDRLVFVGDLVARGPDSLGVLDIVRQPGAIVVRGNHEQKLLDARAGHS